MDKRQGLIVAILGSVLAVLLVAVIVIAANRKPDVIVSDFEAPPFDEGAILGIPEEAATRGDYNSIDVEGSYRFSICGAPSISEGSLVPYFASHGDNEVWLLLKVYDEDGTELGKSGLIRPGECIRSVALSRAPMGKTVRVKILSYEQGTYYSRGTASAVLPLMRE